MSWKLFLDDVRDPPGKGWTVVRSSVMATIICSQRKDLPKFMSLDHDLGGDDNSMRFLKELHYIWEEQGADPKKIPEYIVHSSNPVGAKNIISYMESWKKTANM